MRNEDIKLLLDSLREEMQVGHSLTRATVKAEIDRIEEKVDRVIKHQERQNGRLSDHDAIIAKLSSYPEKCPANQLAEKMAKKWFWAMVAVGVIIVYSILATLYHTTGFGGLIDKIL